VRLEAVGRIGNFRPRPNRLVEGKGGRDLTEAVAECENRIPEITDKMVEPGPGSFLQELDELPTFAPSCLTNLRILLSKPGECSRRARSWRSTSESSVLHVFQLQA
jgi:hypothetical protein